MKRPHFPLFLTVSFFFSLSTACAAGINLSWDACSPEGGTENRSFACNTNSGIMVMYASFALSSDRSSVVGVEAVLDIASQSADLPAWWRFYGVGACRQSLSVSFDFSSDPATACTDPWSGQAIGGIGAYLTYWSTPQVPGEDERNALIRLVGAMPREMAASLTEGTEYYAFKVRVSAAKTVGTSSCAGCQTPVCIRLSEVRVVESDNSSELLTEAITSAIVGWQTAVDCAGSMPERSLTWGEVKALYR